MIKTNNKELTSKEVTVIEELVYGALQYGVQSSGYLEDEKGLSPDEQIKIIEGIQKKLDKEEQMIRLVTIGLIDPHYGGMVTSKFLATQRDLDLLMAVEGERITLFWVMWILVYCPSACSWPHIHAHMKHSLESRSY